MKAQKSKEPWESAYDINGRCRIIAKDSREIIAELTGKEAEADMERIVFCVNACIGLNPDAVPELLATLKDLCQQEDWEGENISPSSPIGEAKRAIAKAESE